MIAVEAITVEAITAEMIAVETITVEVIAVHPGGGDNKVQGQTLQFVGIYLPDHVFTHGQLYVAFSRVTDPSALAVCLNNPEGFTRNIVFQEVL